MTALARIPTGGPALDGLAATGRLARLSHPDASDLSHIGGKRGLPLVGVMPQILLDPARFSARMGARHGRIYRFHALGRWHLHVAGAEALERLLFDPARSFSAGEGWGPLVAPLLPGALLLRDGEEHREHRRLMGEAFRQTAIEKYQLIFADLVEQRIGRWQGRRIDAYEEARRLTFEMAVLAFLGLSLGPEADRAMACFARIAGGLLAISYNPWLSLARHRGLAAKAELDRLLAGLVEAKRREPGEDFLSRVSLLRDGEGDLLSTSAISDMFIFLLVAAHDTMSSALCSTLHFLAAHPDWAERLHDEQADAQGPLHAMFFKECVRLNPPAPVVWRRALEDVSFYGKTVPAGTMVGANLMLHHRLENVWPQPGRFDPSRFSPELERERHRFDFAPFGGGIHKCLGMHLAQSQAHSLARAVVASSRLSSASNSPQGWYAWPSCRPRGRLLIDVRRRSPGS